MSVARDGTDKTAAAPRSLTTLIDFAVGSHARAVAFLIALSLVSFLPGFFQVPPVDRDEARFAQATKQMVERGEYVDIRFQDEVRYKKPVGIYWLQVAAVKAGEFIGIPQARTTIALYRLPSLIGAIGAVLLTYWTALAFVARRAALIAAMMMATSVLLGAEARLAKTDAMLLLTVVAAMGAMARIYLIERRAPGTVKGWRLPGLFWTVLAAGILIKGPLILMFVGLTAITVSAFDRSARWLLALRPVAGVIWMLVLVLPWFAAIVSRAGGSFFADSLGHDMLEKVTSGQEAHGAPPGTYLLMYWVTFWPGAVLTLLAAPMVWKARQEPGARFLLCWLAPSWLVFEAVVTKLPHYVLPLYPAIAILIAGILERDGLSKARWLVLGTMGWFIFPVVVAIASITALLTIGGDLGIAAWPFAAGTLVMGLVAWRLYDVDGPERALLRGMVTAVLVAFTVYGVVLPMLPALFPSARLQATLQDASCKHPVAAIAGYHEPSVVFLLGTETRLTDGSGAADFLRQGPCRFAMLEGRNEQRSFVLRAEATGLRYSPVPRVDGFNISIGKPVAIAIFRSGDE
jgi:4-amino-4-deoxy-L-arabinose transferase-like glycosyltransferase